MSEIPSTGECTVSVVYATHRPENIPLLGREMKRHRGVFLEEPSSPDFFDMLSGRTAVEEYLALRDDEYPEFSRRFCHMLREIHRSGASIVQADPFLDVLISIHELFADGGSPADIAPGTEQAQVYAAEHRATGALIGFYRASLSPRFEETVAAVKRFARADAVRFRLRDEMRAEALADRVTAHRSSFVEAGTMHQWLFRRLHRLLAKKARVLPVHLLQPQLSEAGAARRNFGPGDILTLMYLFRPQASGPRLDLLAARSLIYVKVLAKEEIFEDLETFPHLKDEQAAARIADRLSYEDCARLYPSIRRAATEEAREVVLRYLAAKGITVDWSNG